MSRNCAALLVAVTFLSVGTLLGTLIAPAEAKLAPRQIEKEQTGQLRIAYVNIVKILWEFKKATYEGKKIAAKRLEYAAKITPLKDKLKAKNEEIQSSNDAKERATLKKEATALNAEIEKIEIEAQKVLGAMTDELMVEVYQNIRDVTADLAKQRNLDVIEFYPDVRSADDEKKPQTAQLKLQTPALTPLYIRKELLVTDDVLEMLNRKYPPHDAGMN
jgi:Skp family chaperone for outer membrane proteins